MFFQNKKKRENSQLDASEAFGHILWSSSANEVCFLSHVIAAGRVSGRKLRKHKESELGVLLNCSFIRSEKRTVFSPLQSNWSRISWSSFNLREALKSLGSGSGSLFQMSEPTEIQFAVRENRRVTPPRAENQRNILSAASSVHTQDIFCKMPTASFGCLFLKCFGWQTAEGIFGWKSEQQTCKLMDQRYRRRRRFRDVSSGRGADRQTSAVLEWRKKKKKNRRACS